jgi:hypothetical protein
MIMMFASILPTVAASPLLAITMQLPITIALVAMLYLAMRPHMLYGNRKHYYLHTTHAVGCSRDMRIVITTKAWRHSSLRAWQFQPILLAVWCAYCARESPVYAAQRHIPCVSELWLQDKLTTLLCYFNAVIDTATTARATATSAATTAAAATKAAYHMLRQWHRWVPVFALLHDVITVTMSCQQQMRLPVGDNTQLRYGGLHAVVGCLLSTTSILVIAYAATRIGTSACIHLVRFACCQLQQQHERRQAQKGKSTSLYTSPQRDEITGGGTDDNILTNERDTDQWISPSRAGIYCEAQYDHQCLVHAPNAILGVNPAGTRIFAPNFMHEHLQESLSEAQLVTQTPEFNAHGNHSVPAANHYLYEHTHEDVMLVRATSIGVAHDDPPSLTQSQILARCPPGCKELVIWYKHGGVIKHYMAWVKANDNHWYNCESMAFANKQQVKRLTHADWQALKGIVYCLVKGNPYETGLTLLDPPLGYLPGGYNGALDKAWVSGSLVHIHSERVRNLATQVALDRSLLHQPV